MIAHFTLVAKKSPTPVILYNVPGRTVVSMSVDSVAHLSKVPKIVGIKEASGNIETLKQLKLQVGETFLLSSGDDATCIEFALNGGHGVISVISHIIPKELSRIFNLARTGSLEAREKYLKYQNLNRLMGIEANPIPVKMGLYLKGIIASPELRLPLVELSAGYKKELEAELTQLGAL
jgi:4-hydroxy-tetrahydrodipicolinate synthase